MDAARHTQIDLAIQLLAANAASFQGDVFRVLTSLYATTREAFSGNGSRYASGRFHTQGAFLIVYTGCTLRQAEWEDNNTARNSLIAREDRLPLTILSAEVHFSRVLDLTSRPVRRQMKVAKSELLQSSLSASPGETLTQAIGRLAYQHGFEAILAPSRGPGDNLNILPQNMVKGSYIRIVNEDRLPPPP